MKIFTLVILLTLTSVFSHPVHATWGAPSSWTQASHKLDVLKNDGSIYRMIHIQNHGDPVLLIHGWGATAHSMMFLADKLQERGYDVWALNWVNHSRSIDSTGSETIKEFVNSVYAKTGKKVTLIGHSLGGIFARIYAHGVQKDEDGSYSVHEDFINDQVLKKIKSLVIVCSPPLPDNTQSSTLFKIIFSLYPTFPLPTQMDLSFLINTNTLYLDTGFLYTTEMTFYALQLADIQKAYKPLFNFDFYKNKMDQLAIFSRYGSGPISYAVREHFTKIAHLDGIYSEDLRLNYSKLFLETKIKVPVAYIAAEKDSLAPSKDIIREAEFQEAPFLMLTDSGHLDSILGDQVLKSAKFIDEFLSSL